MIEGNSISLVATILPEDAENQNVIWSSSNKAVASVKDGEVTAVSVGEATITAKSEDGGKKATCKVVVSAKHIPVSSVTLDKEEVSLVLEDKMTLTATVTPDNASNKTILWTSSDESIVTVTDGEVTALKVGEATITATSEDGDKKASCKVTVNAKPVPVTGVSLNKQKARVFINDELTLTATVAPEDATNKTLVWTTSNALVATVKNGVVKGISVGEADITVKTEDGNHSATCKVSVTEESQTQTKGPLTLDLGIVTSTTATFNGILDIDMLGDYDMNAGGVGFIYAPADQPLNIVTSSKVQISEVDAQGKFTHTLTGLKYNSEYHYAIFVYKNTICQYGETQVFETVPVDMELSVKDITQTRATISGRLTLPGNDKELEVGVLCSTSSDMTIATEGVKKAVVTDIMDADGGFSHRAERLLFDNTHYYRYYVKQGDTYTYGSVQDFKTETVSGSISVSDITQTRATFNGRIELTEGDLIEVGVLYSQKSDLTVGASGVIKQKLTPDSSGNISYQIEKLQNSTTYNYCYYAYQNGKYTYGEMKTFTTSSVKVTLSVNHITQTAATFDGTAELAEDGLIEVGILYSQKSDLTAYANDVIKQRLTKSSGSFSHQAKKLQNATTYYYCYYVYQDGEYTYGETKKFTTSSVPVSLSVSTTQTTATFDGMVELTEDGLIEVGILYSQGADLIVGASGVVKQRITPDSLGNIIYKAEGLQNATTYNYCYYVCQNGKYTYGETKTFTTQSVSINLSVNITMATVRFDGKVELTEDGVIEVGVLYSKEKTLFNGISGVTKMELTESSGEVSLVANLHFINTTYYYCYYVCQNDIYTYGDTFSFTTLNVNAKDLSIGGTANCYIVSTSGTYKFSSVKGNGTTSVGSVASVEVLWETFGTDVVPSVGDLISEVGYQDGCIVFHTASAFKEGNAVIAAKDTSGKILWSWHIWLTDQPKGQTYYNNAGTMMDRNLGATSVTPGDASALGLSYQWGRKDPFLMGTGAKSTISWPSTVYSSLDNGTIDYATTHPTTFINSNNSNNDWYYTVSSSVENTRWTTSERKKSIYDPCPAGWRVPDGGSKGVWAQAIGPSEYYGIGFDVENRGMNLSNKLGANKTIWYPIWGYGGNYWSASPNGNDAYSMYISSASLLYPSESSYRKSTNYVRCIKE